MRIRIRIKVQSNGLGVKGSGFHWKSVASLPWSLSWHQSPKKKSIRKPRELWCWKLWCYPFFSNDINCWFGIPECQIKKNQKHSPSDYNDESLQGAARPKLWQAVSAWQQHEGRGEKQTLWGLPPIPCWRIPLTCIGAVVGGLAGAQSAAHVKERHPGPKPRQTKPKSGLQ